MIITFKGDVHKCSFRQKEIHVKQQQEIQVFRHFMGADYILQLTPDFTGTNRILCDKTGVFLFCIKLSACLAPWK